MKIWTDTPEDARRKSEANKLPELCASSEPVVEMDAIHFKRFSSYIPGELANVWNVNPVSIEVFGHVLQKTDDVQRLAFPKKVHTSWLKAIWWRSQAVRFMLRRPQPYLCHATNKMRHAVFGRLVAEQVAQIPQEMEFATAQSAEFARFEEYFLRSLKVGEASMDASPLWRYTPPFLPRPIVNIHVRQGDKRGEMRVFSLASHMWLAQRLKRRDPALSNVWLSTEMQMVVDRSKMYSNWTIFYPEYPRQKGRGIVMNDYEKQLGVSNLTLFSFVNLRIAVECDYFIGALGSNWPRLLNEMRMTGGRLRNGYMAVNFDEF
eukprot:TRINITY_DN7023_c0_g1_i1.p1 TRINITY_DN7023_c0_g1~~TRINITY_DN7023_c0_g1_i1.p1  ORF type:complete len:339 (-),score=40.67 TRINITY_DN7023_c0_g1_i1:102-1058(-)